MPDPAGKAVFLSYASQDAAAAARLCEALRGAGVEVWLDQSELVGGDAWDAKIRKQIADCALLVPMISAATQARREGYFRIEWRLAAQRTHAMSDDTAFLLPVVIDDTRNADARVPAEFKAVQWTRLRPAGSGGQARQELALEAFCARVKTLLGGEGRDASPRRPSSDTSKGPGRLGETSLPPKPARPRHMAAWIAAAAVAALGIIYFALRPEKNAGAGTRPLAVEKSPAPLTEARKLTLQARALIDDDFMAVRENYRLADELCQRATALDPLDGEAWATWARVSNAIINKRYDRSEAPEAAARSQAERAIQLAPESVETGLAVAMNRALSPDPQERELRLRSLLLRAPGDKRIVVEMASAPEVGEAT